MSAHPQPSPAPERKPVTLPRLLDMHARGEPITVLTAYDASFGAVLDAAGIEVILIGDSLGMVVQGRDSTLPVTVDEVAYHTACVARGSKTAWIVADLPFGSYHGGIDLALANAVKLMQAGAHMVKVEGGEWLAPTIRAFVRAGIPVCAHLGLTPQSVHVLGGYRVQGRNDASAAQLRADAFALQDAGATMLVLEMVPAALAGRVTAELRIPTIGIGAGAQCSGQVLVLHDMLNVFPGRKPRFVRNFMDGASSIADAVARYRDAVKSRAFPAAEHSF
ncbi:3-methyl-2-oxobutanoate hydroxymethyltransferase [Derxia gummosa]|uniref:3-methyl-2-oxobutanoate hydroxymethyltransferase n=1 Tax=Derxia gummosa DSM 723 TaxID=1121388 RepID=A0A8B6X725_9BURK|nr:3-methyl-2-oxobutanoate hydroxymethyltransferase [Derxia gummosa]